MPLLWEESGLDNVWLENGYVVRDLGADGQEVLVHDVPGLLRALGRSIARQEGALTGQEFRFLREALDWTQTDVAKRLGLADRQPVAAWERRRHEPVPLSADTLVRTCYLETIGEAPRLTTISGLLVEAARLEARPAADHKRVMHEDLARRWAPRQAPKELEIA